jgi:hypothetical protein
MVVLMRTGSRIGPLLALLVLAAPAPAMAVEIIRGPLVQSPGPGQLVIAWETDVPAPGLVAYGENGALDRLAEATVAATRHEIPLEGLAPGVEAGYRVFAGTAHSRLHSFRVPPAAGEPAGFLVLGDNRSKHKDHRVVVESMLPNVTHAVINTGDMVNRGDLIQDWDMFFAVERPLLASTLSFHTMGNHDRHGGSSAFYERFFVHPSSPHAAERDFFVDLGCTRIVLLDYAVTAKKAKTQKAWLASVLAEGRALDHISHLVVAIHHGLHSNGPHGPNASLLKAGLDDVMREHGVAIVMAGHDHSYERGIVDGLRYMVIAGGGAPLYKKTIERGHKIIKSAVHHHVRFAASPEQLRFDVILKDGSVLESCALAPPPQGYACQ